MYTDLLTRRGQCEYALRSPARILSAEFIGNDYNVALAARSVAETIVNDQRILGFPTSFSINNDVLTLFPTPDAEYRVRLLQEVGRTQISINCWREGDGLYCRWFADYNIATDSIITRFHARMGEPLREPRTPNHITPEMIEFALEFYGAQIEDVKRRARENPAEQFMCDFHITHEAMLQRYARPHARIDQQLRVRLPRDYTVRGAPERFNVLFGHMHVRPEWHVGLYSDNPDERNAAYEKSLELLKSWLSPSQLKDYKKHSSFFVIGSDTGTQYRLISERSYNIIEFADGKPTGQTFCVVPAQSVAMGDQLLAQKIWLETDECRTLKIANKIARTGSAGRGHSSLTVSTITREAVQLSQNSNAFLRNLPQYEELLGEADPPTQGDD